MRVAIVGCGKISRAHISALQEIEELAICSVCDRDKDRARRAADLVAGAKAYGDLEGLLRQEQPDAVHVLTPPATHAPLSIQAMEAGCHVLVEKPMALSLQQADRMVATAQKNRVSLCTNHNYLFKPCIVKAKQLVESGAIGQVVYVDSYYGLSGEGGAYLGRAGRSHWAWRLPGGVFTNFLPHLVYLQLAFLEQVDSVAGVTLSPGGDNGRPPTELAILLHGSNAPGTMAISMLARPYAKFMDIYGTGGIVHADLVREICTVHKHRRAPRMVSKVLYSLEDSVQLTSETVTNTINVALGKLQNMPGLRTLLRAFYASLRTDGEPPVSAEDGRRMVAVLEMVWAKSEKESPRVPSTAALSTTSSPQTNAERVVADNRLPGRVLVTGASGFLGQHLVAALWRCGAEVAALVRDPSRTPLNLEQQAQIVCGDVRDPASIQAAMQDAAVIYHCAAITTNRAPWATHYETNVLGTETVLEQALRAGAQRVIHVSSVIVYGLDQPRPRKLVAEDAPYPTKPYRWAHYMRSKIAAEELALRYWQEAKLPVTVLRLGILYGPGGRTIGRGLAQLGGVRFLIGSGRNRMPYTYVQNAVDCLLLAAVVPQAAGQAYNVVDEPQVTVRDAASRRMKITGQKSTLLPVSPLLVASAARLLELRSSLSGSEVPPKLSRYVVRSACRDIRYDTRKASEGLGWKPAVPLEEGLRAALEDQ
jgi:nucleoside-diphosphate-sugar epimerase/predicted dehydrogenase